MFMSSERIVERSGAQIIALDTVMDVYGGNQIAGEQVHGFIQMLRRLAIKCEACVVLSAHVSNEGLSSKSGLSGHRAWNNHVRNRLWLTEKEKDVGGDVRWRYTKKSNYSRRHG